jgi:hypothetical protein
MTRKPALKTYVSQITAINVSPDVDEGQDWDQSEVDLPHDLLHAFFVFLSVSFHSLPQRDVWSDLAQSLRITQFLLVDFSAFPALIGGLNMLAMLAMLGPSSFGVRNICHAEESSRSKSGQGARMQSWWQAYGIRRWKSRKRSAGQVWYGNSYHVHHLSLYLGYGPFPHGVLFSGKEKNLEYGQFCGGRCGMWVLPRYRSLSWLGSTAQALHHEFTVS